MTNQTKPSKPKPKKSSVRHTAAIALDRSKRPASQPPAAQVEQILTELVQPLTYSHLQAYARLGLRQRVLTLPLMMAFVLSLIWRQLGSVSEAVRVLHREGFLGQAPVKVSQQAVSNRLRHLPPALFEGVLNELLPLVHQRWQARTRPVAPALRSVLVHFERILAVDGSTLDAVVKKVGLLREREEEGQGRPLAGKLMGLLDLASQLPYRIWYSEDSLAHDQSFWPSILQSVPSGSLLVFDLGFVNYDAYHQLSQTGRYFVSRVKTNMVFERAAWLRNEANLKEWLIWIGKPGTPQRQRLRLVEFAYNGQRYSYVTNVLDPARLTGEAVAGVYRQRWRIEDAFRVVKRLLGLAYFYGSSTNAISTQVWASWILYTVLVDLTDGIAQELQRPFAELSVEMVYRGLYHYTQAYKRGESNDVIQYLAQQTDLGIIKRVRVKKPPKPPDPDPDQRLTFLFEP